LTAIRAITLDLDDTLWDTPPVIRRAERALRDWLSTHYPRTTERFSAADVMALRRDVLAEHEDLAHDLTFLRREVIRRMGEATGYTDIDVDAAFEVFDRHRNALELFPDVLPALERLARAFTLVAVTNGNARLDVIGIDGLFDGYVSARTAGAAKPSTRIFDAAVEAAGAAPGETLHVGDHPEYDVHGARRAGLRAAWVNRVEAEWPEHLAPPEHVVADMAELAALLCGEGDSS
jgi:2-haloalkanoic acid dehalogenase type II